MIKKIFRNKKVIIALIIVVFSLFYEFNRQFTGLEVIFFDVGQGDSALIRIDDFNILIDGGPDNVVLRRLGENMSFFDKDIDIVILSHYHDDHLIGLVEVLKRYNVGKVIYLEDSPFSLAFKEFVVLIEHKNIEFIALDGSMKIDLKHNCSLSFLSPNTLKVPNNNNNSIINILDCHDKRFLFSGDNEYKVEQALLASELDIDIDIFKASHHGSKTSNREEFLRAVSPDKAIISSGEDNKFGHPSQEVLERFKMLGIKVYRTDQNGSVKISN